MSIPQSIPSRALATLLATALLLGVAALPAQAARSPYETSTPLVVKPPVAKTSEEKPKTDGGGGNPTPQEVPEPASLLTGAVGTGLGLLAWARNRRRRARA